MYYTVRSLRRTSRPFSTFSTPYSSALTWNFENDAKTIWRLLMDAVLCTAVQSLGSRRGHGACALRSLLVIRVDNSFLG
jgi:hypothetical protein